MKTANNTRLTTLLLVVLAIIAMALPAAAKGPKGNIQFTTTTHNFGIIKEKGGTVSCNFEFINAGDGNLIITDARTQCGCTRPQYPEQPVKPGKRNKIRVTFNPIGRPGAFNKSITIYLANDRKKKVVLKIKGTVAK